MSTQITKATELLTTIRDWSKGKFVAKEDGKGLSTNDYTTAEKTKLAGIAEGAQVNAIDVVQVNGSDLPISSKKVNVTVGSGVTNGTIAVNGSDVAVTGLGTAAYKADTYFVAAEEGKRLMTDAEGTKLAGIEAGAQVNVLEGVGVKMPGESTFTPITIASKVGQLDLSQVAMKSDITAVLKFKGSKDTYAEIAAITDAKVGDVWLCRADNSEYVCVAEGSPATWEKLGIAIDLSGYVQKTQKVNNKALNGDIVLDGSDVALTGYAKPSTASAIVATDTVNAAIGKLEFKVDSAISGCVVDATISMPSNEFEVAHSISAGVVANAVTFKNQTARTVLAAPAAGGTPSFRALDIADLDLAWMSEADMLAILNA